MSPEVASTIIKGLVEAIRYELEQASGLALAAEACAERGAIRKATEIANEVDDPAHDAERLLDVITLMKRRYLPADETISPGQQGDEPDA